MRQLRPYQQDLLSRVLHALADHPKGRLMLQLPTGGGKTVIGGALLAHWLDDNRKAVWLTHRKELAEQTRGMLTDAGVSARTNIRWPPGTDPAGHGRRGRHSHGSDRGSADRQTPGLESLQFGQRLPVQMGGADSLPAFSRGLLGDALGTTGLGMPDVPVAEQQVLQLIHEDGYLTGGLPHLLDRLLRQGCIFDFPLHHLPELYRPGLTVILAMKSVMVMRR